MNNELKILIWDWPIQIETIIDLFASWGGKFTDRGLVG